MTTIAPWPATALQIGEECCEGDGDRTAQWRLLAISYHPPDGHDAADYQGGYEIIPGVLRRA
jgi:hypothetical protein